MKYIKAISIDYRNIPHAVLYMVALAIAGCETTIPETDTLPPEIRLTVNGPGIGRQEMSNPPRENWTASDGTQLFDLAPNTEYHFVLTVSDQGGVARANLRVPDNFRVTSLAPESATEEVVGVTRSLTLRGSRADPRTGLIISGRFQTPNTDPGNLIPFEFLMEGDDFGGASGRPNQRFMNVSATVNATRR